MKKSSLFLLTICCFFGQYLFSAYLENIPQVLIQPDGTKVECFASGDQFYHYLHDENNFTIVQHKQTGFFVYAVKRGDDLVASDFIVGYIDPAIVGIEPGLSINPEIIKRRYSNYLQKLNAHDSKAPTTGLLNNVSIFVRFSDQSEYTSSFAGWDDKFNAPTGVSLHSYYEEVSDVQLNITTYLYPQPNGDVIVSYQDSHPRNYYLEYNAVTNPDGYDPADDDLEGWQRLHTMLGNAIDFVQPDLLPGLDFDGDDDGYADNVCFIIQGSTEGWGAPLWPHHWNLYYAPDKFLNSAEVSTYNVQLSSSCGVPVLCHEMGHSLGIPDFYHYAEDSTISPVGSWCLMASESNPPQHMSPYAKYKYLGWIDSLPVINTTGIFTLEPLSTSPFACYKIPSPNSADEYFFLEYRRKEGIFESGVPNSGLIISRIIESIHGNSGGPPDERYIFRPGGTTEINGNLNNANFSADFGRSEFNDFTDPACFLSDGSLGGLIIDNISSPGSTISFEIHNSYPYEMWTGNVSNNWNNPENWYTRQVPNASSNVVIPSGTSHDPWIFLADAQCNDLTIESGGNLSLAGYSLYVQNNMTIHGEFNMSHNDSQVSIQGFMHWEDGSSANIVAEQATIYISGSLGFSSGSNVQMENGIVTLLGVSNSSIWSKSSTSFVNDLSIYKSNAQVSNGSEFSGDFRINGDLIVGAISTFVNSFTQCDIVLKGNLLCSGNLHFDKGGLSMEGVNQEINITSENYFNNITINSSGVTALLDPISINGNLVIESGSLATNDYDIIIKGDWTNNVGTAYSFQSGTAAVTFNGAEYQYCHDEQFYELIVDKSSSEFIIPPSSDVICDSYNWVSGFLTVDGGTFTANDLYHNNIVGSYQLIDGQIDLYQDATHYVDINGNIIIYNGSFNIYGGVDDCYFAHMDDAYLYMEGGILDVKDWGIHFDDGHQFNHVITGGTIKMNGSFTSARHDFSPSGGYVHLYGSENAVINFGWGNVFHHLVINKQVSKVLAKNENNKAKIGKHQRRKTKISPERNGDVELSQDLTINGNMEITSGQLNLAGHLLRIDGSLAIYGTLKMVNSLDELITGNDLVWRTGSSSVISAGNIALGRDWFFKDGCTVNIGTGNTVTFTGTQISTISIAEFDNATFGNVILDKTESYTARDSYFSSYTKVTGNLTLNSMNEFRSKNTTIDGNLFMDMGSQILIDWGQMDVNGDVDCFGHLNLAGGDFTSYEDFILQEEGELTIDGGFCSLYKTYTGNYLTFAGVLNLLDGDLEVWDENVRFTTTPNIVNGNIRLGRGLQAIGYGAFQPNSGAVYFIGSEWSNIDMGNRNYFHDLIIQKSEPLRGCIPNDSLLVNNNLTINSGKLQGAGVTVGNTLTIGSSGILDPYNNLVKIGGNWTNSRGATGFVEGSGTVEFFGTSAGSITTSETFNNLELNRDTGNFYYSDLAEGVTVHVENNLTLYNGKLLINNNATLDVDKDILMFDGTGIRVFEDAVGTEINLGGALYDYNNDNSNYSSFIPGTSTFTCDGDSTQVLYTNRYSYDFNHFNIDITNPAEPTDCAMLMFIDVNVYGDLNIINGVWTNYNVGLNHNFYGDVSICENGWNDNLGQVAFLADHQTTFERMGSGVNFYDVYIGSIPRKTDVIKNREGTNLVLNSGFTAEGNIEISDGILDANGYDILCAGNLTISYGKLALNESSTLTMGEYKSLTVYDGGILETLGSSDDNIEIKNENSYAYHMFNIENGGTILAENTIFQNCGYEGLYVKSGATVGDSGNYEFTNCTFTNGTGGGYLLTIDNSQTLEIENAVFPANTWGCYANVRKYVDFGSVTFVGATGDFSGEYYDEDMYNRINWITGPVLEFSPDYLIFGDVPPDNSVTQYMNIYNSGDRNLEGSITVPEGLTISEMIWKTNSNKNSETHRNVLNFDIPASNMVNYEIVFEPMELMDYSGFITITHNAGEDSLVAYLARGTAAKLEANPLLLEPVITENSPSSETLSISNTGNATLEYFAYFEYESASKSTIIDEGFEGTQFPPTGWSVEAVDPSSMNWYDSDFEPHSGAKHAYADMMTIDSRLITSSFTATSNTYLSCWLKSNDFMAKNDAKFGVEVSTDGSNWTMLKQISPSNLALTYQRILLDLSFYNSQTIQLAFRIFDNDAMMAEFYLDDILVSGSTLSENWLSLNGENSFSSQIIAGNPAEDLLVGFDANGLSVGEYAATIWLISNSYIDSELSIPVSLTVSPASIDIPQNLTIEIVGSNIVLNWEAVSRNRAMTYKIYSSDDPNAPFETWDFENQVSSPTWSETIPESPKFYRVTACN